MTYYVATPDNRYEGPFSIEELRSRGIAPDTLVYNKQLGQWTQASLVPEIAQYVFQNSPYNRTVYQEYAQPNFYQKNSLRPIAPKTWLAESILVTLLCCLPFGIVGIIKAASVDSLFRSGDYEGAQLASQSAGKWTKIGFFCGLAAYIIYFIISFLSVFASFAVI